MKTVGIVANPTKDGVREAIDAVRGWCVEHGLDVLADDVIKEHAAGSVSCVPSSELVERAVKQRCRSVKVHANDVSLLSCALGAPTTGASFRIAFRGRLGFIEEQIDPEAFQARLAAVLVGLQMAKHKGDNALGITPLEDAA